MITVGIDVSKDWSTVAAVALGGDRLIQPTDYRHTEDELNALVERILSLPGEVRVVLESTGRYHEPLLYKLHHAKIYVCVVNPLLTKGYNNNSIRKIKTDKHDADKLGNYGLEKWNLLSNFIPPDAVYTALKDMNRQVALYTKNSTAAHLNLISLLDVVYPGIKGLFNDSPRKDGRIKWMDYLLTFWHCEYVRRMKPEAFCEKYRKWCGKNGYHFSRDKATALHRHACQCVPSKPMSEPVMLMVTTAVKYLVSCKQFIFLLHEQMYSMAESLPEFQTVMSLHGVGRILGPKLMAEIGDVRRFNSKNKLVAFAGLDPPPYSSGKFESKHRRISKRGPSHLRTALYLVADAILMNKCSSDPVFQFMDRKRAEGKHYKVYKIAGARKFLHIYFARVMEFFNAVDTAGIGENKDQCIG
jgi:transposase